MPTEPTPEKRAPDEVTPSERRLRRIAATWARAVSTLRHLAIGASRDDPNSMAAEFTAASRELRRAADELKGMARGIIPGEIGVSNDPIQQLTAAVQAIDDETPGPGVPRSEWTDVQVLLTAAYRLADLADALANDLTGDLAPATLAETLANAHAILDATDRST